MNFEDVSKYIYHCTDSKTLSAASMWPVNTSIRALTQNCEFSSNRFDWNEKMPIPRFKSI